MARIRTIKPEFWSNESLSSLPEPTHMLAAALLNYADDEGYFNANPALVKAACFPLREPSVSTHCMLTQLSEIGYLKTGRADDGRTYGHIIKFVEHQRINRASPSKIKDLKISWNDSLSTHRMLTEPSLSPHTWNGMEQGTGNREQGKEGKGSGETQKSSKAKKSATLADETDRIANHPFPPELASLSRELWVQWVQVRQAMPKARRISPEQPPKLLAQLTNFERQGHDANKILEAAYFGKWQGLHANTNTLRDKTNRRPLADAPGKDYRTGAITEEQAIARGLLDPNDPTLEGMPW